MIRSAFAALVMSLVMTLGIASLAYAATDAELVEAEAFFGNTLAIFDVVMASSARAAQNLGALMSSVPAFPGEVSGFFARLSETGFSAVGLFFRALFYLGLGVLAEMAYRAVLARVRPRPDAAHPVTMGQRAAWGLANFFGLGIFTLVGGWPLLMATQADPIAQTVVMTYLSAIVAVRLFAIAIRMVLSPFRPEMRVANLSDPDARKLYSHALMIAIAAAFFFTTATLFHAGGMASTAVLLFVLVTRSLVATAVILAFFGNRAGIARMIAQGPEGRPRGKGWSSFALVWHLFATIYVVLSWFAATVLLLLGRAEANELAMLSFVVIMGLLAICLLLDDWAARVDLRNRDPEQPDMPSFAQFFARLGRASAVVATIVLMLRIWSTPWGGIGLASRVSDGVVPALTQMFITFFIAYVLWQLVLIGSERVLARSAPREGESETARQTRIATLLPLVRNIMLVGIAIVAGMIGLSAIGVDVLPLFAGAGVIGLAIGMGSQTLVKDIVSGIFFLLDDAFRVGDYVDTGSAMGTIERAGIRSLQIRHHLGALHTVPFGEIQTIANHSRDWVIFKMDFRVPFDTDTHALRKRFKELGKELLKDEGVGHLFVEPLKSAGVVMMDESAMIVRASFKCHPGEQFQLRRIVYEQVRKMFKEEGIDVAVREVRVRSTGGGSTGAAGAQVAIEDALKQDGNP
ncbi:mechanosensitive ion channel family protein [Shimia sediminis]|uniref:mechanosensitive ion channel family protein n=1 Tax=Shimia sediminis TaxID=2497945 RepID=UPI0013DF86C6|nr:mechanosensitive ion channel domain-containing protein [Shimia sediminis]